MTAVEPFDDLRRAFEAQVRAFHRSPYPPWDVRRDRLARLRHLVTANERAIEAAIDADFGNRPHLETQIAECYPSLSEVGAALRHGRQWMKPRRTRVSTWFLPAKAAVVPRPLGVVGIIVPWNYPLYLAIGPMTGALAAGNRVMVKLSRSTPRFGELFADLVDRQFRPDEVHVIPGADNVAAAFAALPFDHLLFTGSAVVGRQVMAVAAANLTPVTLELGGKSPAVVAPDYPIEAATTRILAGKLLNAGQTCIAPDYALVPRGSIEAFVEAARTAAQRMYPGGLGDRGYTSIIDQGQFGRLAGYLTEARAAGVRVELLFDGPEADAATRRMSPMLLVDPGPDLAAMRDEIFGPLLPVLPYDRVEDAVAVVNSRPRPLALYWFDHDRQRSRWALRHTHAGGACINETLLHIAQHSLPFGGVGASGMGHYHGRWGFDTFSKLQPVLRQSRTNAMAVFTPPYGRLTNLLLRAMKRF